MAALSRATWLSGLEALNLSNNFSRLAGSPHGDEGLLSVCRMPHLSSLRGLFAGRVDSDGMIEAILGSPHLTRLQRLTLDELRPESVITLARTPWPAGWRMLYLCGPSLDDRVAEALAGSESLGQLEMLILAGPIGDRGIRALLDSDKLSALQLLRLTSTTAVPALRDALREDPRLRRLQSFHCSSFHFRKDIHYQREG